MTVTTMILWPAVSHRVWLVETGHWLGMDMAGFCTSLAVYREDGVYLLRGALTVVSGTVSMFLFM